MPLCALLDLNVALVLQERMTAFTWNGWFWQCWFRASCRDHKNLSDICIFSRKIAPHSPQSFWRGWKIFWMDDLWVWVTMSPSIGPYQESTTSLGKLSNRVKGTYLMLGAGLMWLVLPLGLCMSHLSWHLGMLWAEIPLTATPAHCEEQDLDLEAARSVGETVEITFACSRR